MANVITYGVTLDASGAINGFKRLDDAIDKNAAKVSGWEKRATLAGAAIGTALGTGAVLALRKMVAETEAAQYAQAQLMAALKSTGGAAGLTSAQLNAQAREMQRLTTFSDDAVTSMQSVLLTFTKVGGETFPRATKAIADLATRMGGDLQGAAVQVGKALNDPITGITALTRVGVSFTESQKAVIRELAETNRLAEAQAMILRELETEFGGSAEAARNTLGGAIKALGNAWGDLFEVSERGTGSVVRGINAIADALPRMRDGVLSAFNLTPIGQFGRALAALLPDGPDGGDSVTFTATGGASRRALAAEQERRAELVRLATERRKAFDEAKAQAAERQRWEDQLLETFVLQQQAIFARDYGTGGPALGSLTLNSVRDKSSSRPVFGGVTRLPEAMRQAPGLSLAQARAKAEAEIALAAEREMMEERQQITENFLRGAQSSFAGFFRSVLTDGVSSFRDLMGSFRDLVLNTVSELAAKRLMDSIFSSGKGGAGGLFGGLLSNPLAIGLGVAAFTLGGIFGGSSGPSYRANRTPRYDANGQQAAQVQAREWLARQNANGETGAQIRQSVGGVLTETSASRIVGNLESIRVGIFRLVALAESGAMGGATVNVTAGASGSPGASVAALVDRAMGVTTQRLRLASGAAVIG